MRVKDLIEFLKDVDPEDDIITYDPDEWEYYTCTVKRYKGCVAIEHYYSNNYERVKHPDDYVKE